MGCAKLPKGRNCADIARWTHAQRLAAQSVMCQKEHSHGHHAELGEALPNAANASPLHARGSGHRQGGLQVRWKQKIPEGGHKSMHDMCKSLQPKQTAIRQHCAPQTAPPSGLAGCRLPRCGCWPWPPWLRGRPAVPSRVNNKQAILIYLNKSGRAPRVQSRSHASPFLTC